MKKIMLLLILATIVISGCKKAEAPVTSETTESAPAETPAETPAPAPAE
ncbi:MAG: hypothetical protein V1833_01705 [Elusimicrobiota bacterium]